MPALDPSLLLLSPAFEVTALLLGLMVGSFANVCIHRLPQAYEPAAGRLGWARDLARELASIGYPPSRCPACGTGIRAWDNVPVLSWMLLHGRCRACRAPISLRYPLVEATNGLLWLAVAEWRGPQPLALADMLLVTALLILLLIDREHHLLPDAITLPGTAFGLGTSFLPGARVDPLTASATALFGYLAFAALAWGWKKLRGIDALGEGDWKMAAMLGAFLGPQGLLLTLLLASTAGSIVGVASVVRGRGDWQSRLPLGTFLGAAGIVVVFFGEPALSWYRDLLHG